MASHGSVRPSTCAKKTKTLETEHKHPYSMPEPAPNSAFFFTTQMILVPEWIVGASVAGPGPTPPATTESRPPSADAAGLKLTSLQKLVEILAPRFRGTLGCQPCQFSKLLLLK